MKIRYIGLLFVVGASPCVAQTAPTLSIDGTLPYSEIKMPELPKIAQAVPDSILPKIDYFGMRVASEKEISRMLVDPSSAQFEWPSGFMEGYWKPLLGKRQTGYVSCGFVNAKNRMGGYTGRTAFVVVVNNGVVTYADIGRNADVDIVAIGCAKTVFPPAQPEMFAEQADVSRELPSSSIADELEKLAGLRDRGVISQDEFVAEKNRLLSHRN